MSRKFSYGPRPTTIGKPAGRKNTYESDGFDKEGHRIGRASTISYGRDGLKASHKHIRAKKPAHTWMTFSDWNKTKGKLIHKAGYPKGRRPDYAGQMTPPKQKG